MCQNGFVPVWCHTVPLRSLPSCLLRQLNVGLLRSSFSSNPSLHVTLIEFVNEWPSFLDPWIRSLMSDRRNFKSCTACSLYCLFAGIPIDWAKVSSPTSKRSQAIVRFSVLLLLKFYVSFTCDLSERYVRFTLLCPFDANTAVRLSFWPNGRKHTK